TRDRPADRLVSIILGDLRKGGEPFPAVEGPGSRREAVPTAVRLLGPPDPSDGPLDGRVIEVPEPDQSSYRVSGHTDLAAPSAEVPSFPTPSIDEQTGGPANAGVGPGHSEVGQDNRVPVRGDVLWPV